MKVWVILESFTDYEGGNATSFGVFKSKESAAKNLTNAVLERFGFGSVEEFEDCYDVHFEVCLSADKESWTWDRGEDIIEFYIQEDCLED